MAKQYIDSEEHFQDEIRADIERDERYKAEQEEEMDERYGQQEHDEWLEEQKYDDECERTFECTCGAYVMINNKPCHVADCICGAD